MPFSPLFFFLSSIVSADWKTDVVAQVNALRATHGAPPVIWDTTLEAFANMWATRMATKNTGLFHSTGFYGENLAMFGGGCAGGPNNCTRNAVDLWYAEGSDYVYGNNSQLRTLHFTQVVWVSTTAIGAAVVKSANPARNYVVMEFNPPGNYLGHFLKNVLPPLKYPSPCPSPSPSPALSPPSPYPSSSPHWSGSAASSIGYQTFLVSFIVVLALGVQVLVPPPRF